MSPIYTDEEAIRLEDIAVQMGGRIIQRDTTPDGATLVRIRIGARELTRIEDPDGNYYIQ